MKFFKIILKCIKHITASSFTLLLQSFQYFKQIFSKEFHEVLRQRCYTNSYTALCFVKEVGALSGSGMGHTVRSLYWQPYASWSLSKMERGGETLNSLVPILPSPCTQHITCTVLPALRSTGDTNTTSYPSASTAATAWIWICSHVWLTVWLTLFD